MIDLIAFFMTIILGCMALLCTLGVVFVLITFVATVREVLTEEDWEDEEK